MTQIVIHLKESDLGRALDGWHLSLYRVIDDLARRQGITLTLRQRDRDIRVGTRTIADDRFADGNLHIIDDRSVSAPGVLNAGVAYFWEYWHLDPMGVKAFSSIGDQAFDPDAIDPDQARDFVETLRDRYARKRRSKYDQPGDRRSFPAGALAVFMQGSYPQSSGAARMDDFEMLSIVMDQAGDRRVIVKPHPLASDAYDLALLRDMARRDRRILIAEANVYDILQASAVTISQNSTVALEGFMCGIPAILFARSDFHHQAGTITAPEDFGPTLQAQLAGDHDFSRYLYWYFTKHCLDLHSPDLHSQIWARFEAAGFGRSAFDPAG
ncbi:hypothetical protein JJJ17_15310 [Paracoccus caeni]|uniref:Capsule polysaccharide biosynthesis protein n=1 Tax=Paracoccus caeni TaxID=657651 RepID=A0A934SL75_9RHOB|nr:hypothetical protein [Paracoccus caeni]MBK4217297.1 hypothetical protein [Paracoccus caeni]